MDLVSIVFCVTNYTDQNQRCDISRGQTIVADYGNAFHAKS